MLPILAYWDGDDRKDITEFMATWRTAFSSFQVFGNPEVIAILKTYCPQHVPLFEAIRIPAARADIARLALLYEFGGMYVDCHCGFTNAEDVGRLLGELDKMEAIFVDRDRAFSYRPPHEHFFINSIMLGRPRSSLFYMALVQALSNMSCHREFERVADHVPYHIGALSGPKFITSIVLHPTGKTSEIRQDYRGRIKTLDEESSPVLRNQFRTYGAPGQHWSERQRTELLFDRHA